MDEKQLFVLVYALSGAMPLDSFATNVFASEFAEADFEKHCEPIVLYKQWP